ncbi:MAG: hypothetical protein WCK02_10850 [Bacteroidota bacterium]
MKIFFLLLLSMLSSALYSQNYLRYYKNTNKAEVKIVEAQYDSALFYYDKAFASVDIKYIKDLYNAAICASYTGKTSIGIQYITTILSKGISYKLIKNRAFSPLKTDKSWSIMMKNRKMLVEKGRRNWNYKLKAELDSIYKLDQKFRKKAGSYKVYRDTINALDNVNMRIMNGIISEFGYPDENIIGIKRLIDMYMPDYYIIIRHYYQKKGYDLSDVLLKEVEKGHLHPRVFAELEDKKNNWLFKDDKYGTVVFMKTNGVIKEVNRSNEQLLKYNINRELIGLESYEDYKRKVEFSEKKTPFCFCISEGIVNFIMKKN